MLHVVRTRWVPPIAAPCDQERSLNLGAFSISLAVKDIATSKEFYEKLGFTAFGGDASQNGLILKTGDHAIGLLQGMFERYVLTFNPGWDSNTRQLDDFADVRELQRELRSQFVKFLSEADESTKGPVLSRWTLTETRSSSTNTSDQRSSRPDEGPPHSSRPPHGRGVQRVQPLTDDRRREVRASLRAHSPCSPISHVLCIA